MFEFMSYPFMHRALLVGAASGLVCSVLGVFVVYRRLAFIGAGVSHAAFAGIAIALILGLPVVGTTAVFCALTAVLIGYLSNLGHIKEDTSTGVAYAASMAVGVILFGYLKNQNLDLMGYLFGNILGASYFDLKLTTSLGAAVLIIIYLFYKEFLLIAFDDELAFVSGIPAKPLSYLLLILMAVVIVMAIKAVGIILVSALIVTPAATAMQLSKSFHRIVILSGIVGVVGTETGLIFSYYVDSPPGATVVVLLTVVFLIATLYKRMRFFAAWKEN